MAADLGFVRIRAERVPLKVACGYTTFEVAPADEAAARSKQRAAALVARARVPLTFETASDWDADDGARFTLPAAMSTVELDAVVSRGDTGWYYNGRAVQVDPNSSTTMYYATP